MKNYLLIFYSTVYIHSFFALFTERYFSTNEFIHANSNSPIIYFRSIYSSAVMSLVYRIIYYPPFS